MSGDLDPAASGIAAPPTSRWRAVAAGAIGHFRKADRRHRHRATGRLAGRRDALSLSILLMGLGSLVIGLLPSYATICLAAPILLGLMRLPQGFPAGGEGGVSATFITKHAPPGRRALAGSWRDFSSDVSLFAALGLSAGRHLPVPRRGTVGVGLAGSRSCWAPSSPSSGWSFAGP